MTITREKMIEVAGELEGTCKELDAVLAEKFGVSCITQMPDEMLAILDEEVRCCECCGWWVDASEVNENGECSDCNEE